MAVFSGVVKLPSSATGGSSCGICHCASGVSAGETIGGFWPGASGTNHTAMVVLVTPVRWMASFWKFVFRF